MLKKVGESCEWMTKLVKHKQTENTLQPQFKDQEGDYPFEEALKLITNEARSIIHARKKAAEMNAWESNTGDNQEGRNQDRGRSNRGDKDRNDGGHNRDRSRSRNKQQDGDNQEGRNQDRGRGNRGDKDRNDRDHDRDYSRSRDKRYITKVLLLDGLSLSLVSFSSLTSSPEFSRFLHFATHRSMSFTWSNCCTIRQCLWPQHRSGGILLFL